jgi:hypothetical protein
VAAARAWACRTKQAMACSARIGTLTCRFTATAMSSSSSTPSTGSGQGSVAAGPALNLALSRLTRTSLGHEEPKPGRRRPAFEAVGQVLEPGEPFNLGLCRRRSTGSRFAFAALSTKAAALTISAPNFYLARASGPAGWLA